MVKGSYRRMFRRPGSARRAAGILASSRELMNQVQPVRMQEGGAVADAIRKASSMMSTEDILNIDPVNVFGSLEASLTGSPEANQTEQTATKLDEIPGLQNMIDTLTAGLTGEASGEGASGIENVNIDDINVGIDDIMKNLGGGAEEGEEEGAPEVAPEVAPEKEEEAGDLDALAQYEKLLLEQASRKPSGNFLTDLGLGIAQSAFANPELGKTDAIIAGLTGAIGNAGKRDELQRKRELEAAKGLTTIESIEQSREQMQLRRAANERAEEQAALTRRQAGAPTANIREALASLGAGYDLETGKIIQGDKVFDSVADFRASLPPAVQAEFSRLVTDSGRISTSAVERQLQNLGLTDESGKPKGVRGVIAVANAIASGSGDQRTQSITSSIQGSEYFQEVTTAANAQSEYGLTLPSDMQSNQPVQILQETTPDGIVKIYALDEENNIVAEGTLSGPRSADGSGAGGAGGAGAGAGGDETVEPKFESKADEVDSYFKNPASMDESLFKGAPRLRQNIRRYEQLQKNRAKFEEEGKDVSAIDKALAELEETLTPQILDAIRKRENKRENEAVAQIRANRSSSETS